MGTKLKAGIVGVGGISQDAHIPALLEIAEQVELTACADVNFNRAVEVAARFGFGKAYASHEQMLAEEKLDFVIVSTPNKFHAPVAVTALRSGCHVLCEKPPAMTTEEVEDMVAVATATGRLLTFALHYRFRAEVQALKRLVDAGELGFVYGARVDALRRRGIPGWGVFTNKRLQGGGAVMDIGVHMLDVALYLMGYPKPVQVLATMQQQIGTRPGVGVLGPWDWENFEVEDFAMAMIKFDNGATMLLESSFAQNMGPLGAKSVRLAGNEGGATVFPLEIYKEAHGGLYDWRPAWLPEVENAYSAQMRHFVAACRGEREPMVTLEEALTLQQLLSALYASAEADDVIYVK